MMTTRTSMTLTLMKQKNCIQDFIDATIQLLKNDNHIATNLVNELASDKTVYFVGIGKNEPIAEKTANMLRSLGFKAHSLDATNALHGDLGMLRQDDIVIAISKSGNTSELVHTMQYIRLHQIAQCYAVVLQSDSELSKICQTIELPQILEIDQWNIVPTLSNIALQLFFDALALAAIEVGKPEFRLADFIKSHPGGSIGQTRV